MSSEFWTQQPSMGVFDLNDTLLGIDASDGISKTILGSVLQTGLSPPKLLHVRSEQDLINQFGVDIIIPANEAWTIVVDDSFSSAKPFKLGNNASLEIYGSTIDLVVTFTAAGFFFKNENVLNPGNTLNLHDIDFTGSGINAVFDLNLSFIVVTNDVIFSNFIVAGTITTQFFDFRFTLFTGILVGLAIINPSAGTFNQLNIDQPASPVMITAVSIISSGSPQIIATNCFSSDSTLNMFYFSPLVNNNASFVVNNTTGTFAELFTPGPPQNVISVLNDGGLASFVFAAPHGFTPNNFINMSGFSESSYNGEFKIVSTPSATEIITGVSFVADDSGVADPSSLDSTDIQVLAKDNPRFPASMTTGNYGLELASSITVTINTQDVPEPITNVNWTLTGSERTEVDSGTPDQGRLVIKNKGTRKYTITYSATINRSGGGGVDVGIVLLKNDVIVGSNPPRAFTTAITPLTRTDTIEVDENDVLQVAVINYAGIVDIDVLQANLNLSLTN